MPKDRRSPSLDRCRASPYSRCYKNSDKRKPRTPALPIGNESEWEEARCPICMEHPHNAVLLHCSSREKGCRPYMCDTSYRHSNCLDQFRKSCNKNVEQTKLVCPLCRGQINGCTVVSPARKFMDSKTRSCSLVSCDFSGNYSELRKHARRKHPNVRPTEVDPEQEQEWRSLEENMEQQDMLSMQFEFVDDDDESNEDLLDGISELASPLGFHNFDLFNFFSNIETELDSVFPELDWDSEEGSLFMTDWHNEFNFSSVYDEIESREASVRSRETTRSRNRSSAWPIENTSTTSTRSRTRPTTNTHPRERSNSQQRSRNRQDQVTAVVDFHEFSSNLPEH